MPAAAEALALPAALKITGTTLESPAPTSAKPRTPVANPGAATAVASSCGGDDCAGGHCRARARPPDDRVAENPASDHAERKSGVAGGQRHGHAGADEIGAAAVANRAFGHHREQRQRRERQQAPAGQRERSPACCAACAP